MLLVISESSPLNFITLYSLKFRGIIIVCFCTKIKKLLVIISTDITFYLVASRAELPCQHCTEIDQESC